MWVIYWDAPGRESFVSIFWTNHHGRMGGQCFSTRASLIFSPVHSVCNVWLWRFLVWRMETSSGNSALHSEAPLTLWFVYVCSAQLIAVSVRFHVSSLVHKYQRIRTILSWYFTVSTVFTPVNSCAQVCLSVCRHFLSVFTSVAWHARQRTLSEWLSWRCTPNTYKAAFKVMA